VSPAEGMAGDPAGSTGKSVLAVVAGLVFIFAASLGIDEVLHLLQVYPPWNQPMRDPGLNALALSYRLVIDVAGCYLAARLAPNRPLRHSMILGGIGLVLSILGVLGAMKMDFGPLWYPIALVVTALPTAWLGGWLVERRGETKI